jgi:hypothetical protein
MTARKLLLGGATLAVLALACSAWRTLSPSSLPREGSLDEVDRRTRELDALFQRLHASTEVIRQIHEDLIERRLSFAQALAALRAEYARRPPVLRPQLAHHGRSAEERLCWTMLGYLRVYLADDPRRDSALPRIRAQGRRYLVGLGADTGDFDARWRALAWAPAQ